MNRSSLAFDIFYSCRITLQQIVGFAQGQHQELMAQQEQLLQAHDRLASNSKSMLEAQVSLFHNLIKP